MAQFGRPISDIQNTSITNGFGAIDEVTASDADFLYSADNVNTVYECGLTTTLSDPLTGSDHIVRYRVAEIDGGVLGDGAGSTATVAVSLYQGATAIATDTTRNGTSSWTTYSFTLTTGEADNITDYTDLRLYFDITGGGGSPTNRRGIGVSWGVFETPTRITSFDESVTLTSDNTLTDSALLIITSSVTLTSDNTITITGGAEFDESATLTTDNTLSSLADVLFDLGITLNSDNQFTATSSADFIATSTLTSDNTLSSTGSLIILSSASLDSDHTLDISGGSLIDESVTLTTDNTFTSSFDYEINASVTLTSDNTLDTTTYVDFNPTLSLTSDNSLTDSTLGDSLDSVTFASDITFNSSVENIIFDSLSLLLDSTIVISGQVVSIYDESVNVNAFAQLYSSGRKTHLLTISNITIIRNIGKIR